MFARLECSVQCAVCRFFDVPVIFRFFFNLDAFALMKPPVISFFLDRKPLILYAVKQVKNYLKNWIIE